MKHEDFWSTWCRTFMHTREKHVFSLYALRVSLSPTSREGPFHVMFVRTPMNFESQDAVKNNVCTRRLKHLTIHEDDDIVDLHGRHNHFSQCLILRFFQCLTMPTSSSTGIRRVNDLYQEPISEDYHCKEEEQCDS